jgi:hypothetical protein
MQMSNRATFMLRSVFAVSMRFVRFSELRPRRDIKLPSLTVVLCIKGPCSLCCCPDPTGYDSASHCSARACVVDSYALDLPTYLVRL